MSKQVLHFKDHRRKCKYCGHYLDEHMFTVFDSLTNKSGYVCQRVMEIKNGKTYYTCGCKKGFNKNN
jgi:hypothetical protein